MQIAVVFTFSCTKIYSGPHFTIGLAYDQISKWWTFHYKISFTAYKKYALWWVYDATKIKKRNYWVWFTYISQYVSEMDSIKWWSTIAFRLMLYIAVVDSLLFYKALAVSHVLYVTIVLSLFCIKQLHIAMCCTW